MAGSVAERLFTLLVRHAPDLGELLGELLGRPVRGRVFERGRIGRINPPGLARLRTSGPVLQRHVVLEDSLPPHLPVAVSWALVAVDRLPKPARVALARSDEPLHAVLDGAGLRWAAELLEVDVSRVGAASVELPWAAPALPLLEQARLLSVGEGVPVAATLDEVAFLPPREAAQRLLPLRPGGSRGGEAP